MILLIDNYDSFTYNLYQYFGTFTDEIRVVRNDTVTLEEIRQMHRKKLYCRRDRKARRKPESVWTW